MLDTVVADGCTTQADAGNREVGVGNVAGDAGCSPSSPDKWRKDARSMLNGGTRWSKGCSFASGYLESASAKALRSPFTYWISLMW